MVWWVMAALASDAGWIAPGPAELRASLETLEARLAEAEAVGRAAERLQNAWGTALAAGVRAPCAADPAAHAVAARVVAFGAAWRDAAQRARAEDGRLAGWVSSETVAPLLDPETGARVASARARVQAQSDAWMEFLGWQARYFTPTATGCTSALSAAPGVALALPVAPDERSLPVAIIGVGGGTVCPVGAPADGRVVLLPNAVACMGDGDCSCAPAPVSPGAVLFGRPGRPSP
jgi:hypothetical protein